VLVLAAVDQKTKPAREKSSVLRKKRNKKANTWKSEPKTWRDKGEGGKVSPSAQKAFFREKRKKQAREKNPNRLGPVTAGKERGKRGSLKGGACPKWGV